MGITVIDRQECLGAPCGSMVFNKTSGKYKMLFASVRCNYKCETCGFNPEEQRRRLNEGHYVTETITHELHDDKMTKVVDRITKPCRILKFKRRTDNA